MDCEGECVKRDRQVFPLWRLLFQTMGNSRVQTLGRRIGLLWSPANGRPKEQLGLESTVLRHQQYHQIYGRRRRQRIRVSYVIFHHDLSDFSGTSAMFSCNVLLDRSFFVISTLDFQTQRITKSCEKVARLSVNIFCIPSPIPGPIGKSVAL